MRLGWFRPVHCKSSGAQETRALLTARKLVQSKLRDVENSLRGILRGFGLKVGKTTRRSFAGRVRELTAGHPALQTIGQALLAVHAVLLAEFNGFEKRVRIMARGHIQARLLMTTPAVGPIVALTYAAAVDDPARFKSSKAAGAHFGLVPKKHQSGEKAKRNPGYTLIPHSASLHAGYLFWTLRSSIVDMCLLYWMISPIR
jgi:transposase